MKKIILSGLLFVATSSVYAAHITYTIVDKAGNLGELVFINSAHISQMSYHPDTKKLVVRHGSSYPASFEMDTVDQARQVMGKLLDGDDKSLIELKVSRPKYSGEELKKHMQYQNMKMLQEGKTVDLPFGVSKEQDDQLVEEGVLKPLKEGEQPGANLKKRRINATKTER